MIISQKCNAGNHLKFTSPDILIGIKENYAFFNSVIRVFRIQDIKVNTLVSGLSLLFCIK